MSQELATVPTQELSIGGMMEAVIKGGITAENVGALDKMMDLYERMEAKNAEKAFNAALVEFQSEMPTLVAQSVIPNRGKYERYEDIMNIAGPLLIKHGFSVFYSQAADGQRIAVTCSLRHKGGHSTQTTFAVRLGGKADSETQADCKASTTAKRNAFCLALNITIRQDELEEADDARLLGPALDDMAAEHLKKRFNEVGGDADAFLKMFGVESFHHIPLSRLEEAHRKLDAKERKAKGVA